MSINSIDRNELDVFPEHYVIVSKLVESYKPQTREECPVAMNIMLNDDTPISCSPRLLPIVEQETVKVQLDDWLKQGIIRNVSGEFCSPVVVSRKKRVFGKALY